NAHLSEIIRQHPNAYWVERLNKAGVPCGPINTIDQTFADPQVRHLGMATPMHHPGLGELSAVASPINMTGIKRGVRRATPEAGEHSDEVLRAVGYTDAEISNLRNKGVV